MPIRLKCPQCQTAYLLHDNIRGQQTRCQNCDQVLIAGRPRSVPPTDKPQAPAKRKPLASASGLSAPVPKRAAALQPIIRTSSTLSRHRRRGPAGLILGVSAGLVAVVLVCGGAVAGLVYLVRPSFDRVVVSPTTEAQPTKPPEPLTPEDKDGGEPRPPKKDNTAPPNNDHTAPPNKDNASPQPPDPPNKDNSKPVPEKPPDKPSIEVPVDHWPKLRSRGGDLYYADATLRAVFARDNPKGLPEALLSDVTAPTFDWSTRVVSRPRILNQQKHPNCWAFATVSAFEWNWAIRNGGPAPELSIQPILDHTQEGGTDEGSNPSVALKALVERGTCPDTAYPYTGKPGTLREDVPLNYRTIAWGSVTPRPGIPPETDIKQALLDHGPVVVSVWTTEPFTQYKKGEIFKEHHKRPADGRQTNHELVIVGWDDTKGKGCWKVQNSWGENWGEGGFMWIEYGCNNVGMEAYWVRPQSVHYRLPENAHQLVPGKMTPFPGWPLAVGMPLPPEPKRPVVTVAEALKKPDERVIVQFQPMSQGSVLPDGHFVLRSERSDDAAGCLNVWILKAGLHRFPAQDGEGLWKLYGGKQLRVHGTVTPWATGKTGDRMINLIEVSSPDQIEVVK
jgi:C1A family cysteine protease